jgi:hypothetical protein
VLDPDPDPLLEPVALLLPLEGAKGVSFAELFEELPPNLK